MTSRFASAFMAAAYSSNGYTLLTSGFSVPLPIHSNICAKFFASSAGFLDKFEETVRFPVFASVGTDDFNHYEMYRLDRGNDRNMRAHQPGQRRDLAGVVHAHFEHGDFARRVHAKNG